MGTRVIRPTGSPDSFTLWESEKPRQLTGCKPATRVFGSDNVSCVFCEDPRFTWCEYEVKPGGKCSTGPTSNLFAGIMSTCESFAPQITFPQPQQSRSSRQP